MELLSQHAPGPRVTANIAVAPTAISNQAPVAGIIPLGVEVWRGRHVYEGARQESLQPKRKSPPLKNTSTADELDGLSPQC